MLRSSVIPTAFSVHELKRITELLTKRFYDPHSQVFNAFLDVLPEFIVAYKRELNEWLYTLLTRLLIRLGAPDLLDSVYKKLKTCLSIVNTSFDVHAQFTVLIRFINDNSSAPGIKAKETLLRYLQQILQQMEPVDIANNADIRIALSKIINWSSEPKSIEMRKVTTFKRKSDDHFFLGLIGCTRCDSCSLQSQSTGVYFDVDCFTSNLSSECIWVLVNLSNQRRTLTLTPVILGLFLILSSSILTKMTPEFKFITSCTSREHLFSECCLSLGCYCEDPSASDRHAVVKSFPTRFQVEHPDWPRLSFWAVSSLKIRFLSTNTQQWFVVLDDEFHSFWSPDAILRIGYAHFDGKHASTEYQSSTRWSPTH